MVASQINTLKYYNIISLVSSFGDVVAADQVVADARLNCNIRGSDSHRANTRPAPASNATPLLKFHEFVHLHQNDNANIFPPPGLLILSSGHRLKSRRYQARTTYF